MEVSLFWLNIKSSIKKPLPTAVEIFIIAIFDVKQACKKVPKENCTNWNSPATFFASISIQSLAKLWKVLKRWGLKETGASYEQSFGFTNNQAQYFAKRKKIKQIWIRLENFDISFCIRFHDCYQKLVFGRETGH